MLTPKAFSRQVRAMRSNALLSILRFSDYNNKTHENFKPKLFLS
jgi:hypothetical protein